MDEDDLSVARRLAAMDQVAASVDELARIVSSFYRSLVRAGVPRRVAADLARDLLASLTGRSGAAGGRS